MSVPPRCPGGTEIARSEEGEEKKKRRRKGRIGYEDVEEGEW